MKYNCHSNLFCQIQGVQWLEMKEGKVPATLSTRPWQACANSSKSAVSAVVLQASLYAATRLQETERNQLEQVVQSRMYTCGSELFPPESPLHDTVICRQPLNCCDTMETQYFSSVCAKFPPVCYFCGSPEETLAEDECAQTLKTQYAVVRPICFLCRSDGKHPATWGASNVAKRSKPWTMLCKCSFSIYAKSCNYL